MQLTHQYRIDAPAEAVRDVLLSEPFATAAEAQRRETVLTSHYLPGDEPGSFELRSIEYDRGKYGRIDRSKTLSTTTRCHWTEANRTLHWSYEGVGRDIMAVSGRTRLEPARDGTLVVAEVDVDVTIPIVGRIVERAVAGAFRQGFANEQALLVRHLGDGLRDVA